MEGRSSDSEAGSHFPRSRGWDYDPEPSPEFPRWAITPKSQASNLSSTEALTSKGCSEVKGGRAHPLCVSLLRCTVFWGLGRASGRAAQSRGLSPRHWPLVPASRILTVSPTAGIFQDRVPAILSVFCPFPLAAGRPWFWPEAPAVARPLWSVRPRQGARPARAL